MKIKHKIQALNIVPIVMILLIGIISFLSYFKLSGLIEKSIISESIVIDTFDLNTLLFEYLRYPSERSRKQWLIKHKSISVLLDELITETNDEEVILNLLRRHSIRINLYFNDLYSILEKKKKKKKN